MSNVLYKYSSLKGALIFQIDSGGQFPEAKQIVFFQPTAVCPRGIDLRQRNARQASSVLLTPLLMFRGKKWNNLFIQVWAQPGIYIWRPEEGRGLSGEKNIKRNKKKKKIWLVFTTINGKTNPVPLPARRIVKQGFDLQEWLSEGLVERASCLL